MSVARGASSARAEAVAEEEENEEQVNPTQLMQVLREFRLQLVNWITCLFGAHRADTQPTPPVGACGSTLTHSLSLLAIELNCVNRVFVLRADNRQYKKQVLLALTHSMKH